MEEALLCDEVWLQMSPSTAYDDHDQTNTIYARNTYIHLTNSFYLTKHDFENALKACIQKELNHMPQPGYKDLLESNQFMSTTRFIAIQWLFQSQSRFSLTTGTIFNAVNYFDRFISMNHQCHEWKPFMFELLSLACLSIACKYSETAPPPFHEMQESLDNSYESCLIQRMELALLKSIGWGLNCVTPYSYVELMTWEMNISIWPHLLEEITSQLTEVLATFLLGYKLLAFRPCIIALTGIKYLLKELLPAACDEHIAKIINFIPQDQRENLIKCEKLLKEMFLNRFEKLQGNGQSIACYPSSPVTVLTKVRAKITDQQVDCSLLKIPTSLNNASLMKSNKKRVRDEH